MSATDADERIAECWMHDMTVAMIADETKIGVRSVEYRVRTMREAGVIPASKSRWTTEQRAKLRELVELGVDFGAIALELGRPTTGCIMQASRLGIRRKRDA